MSIVVFPLLYVVWSHNSYIAWRNMYIYHKWITGHSLIKHICLKAILLVFQYILASKCSNVVINVIVWFAVYTLKKLESDNDTEQTKITLSILISIMHVVRILQNNSMEIQRLESSSPFGTLKENIQKHLVRDYFINAIKGLTS